MKMIQTLGYRVGICSVWHPRFKSVHKHRKCIDCLFCFFSELLQVRDQQRGDVHPLHPQTVWHASAGGELHRYSRISHSWTRAERVTNARLTLSGLFVCRGRVHPAVILGAAALGRASSEGVPALSCSDRVAPQGGTLQESHPLLQQGEGEGVTRSAWALEVTSCFINGNVKLAQHEF